MFVSDDDDKSAALLTDLKYTDSEIQMKRIETTQLEIVNGMVTQRLQQGVIHRNLCLSHKLHRAFGLK